MKILVCCPGAWSYGLYSPERGEGRWAQNFARMLAAAGYEVWACSGGTPKQNKHLGVNLINQSKAREKGPYDLYFDSSWWKGKKPCAKAKKYFATVWGSEPRFFNDATPVTHIAHPFEFQAERFNEMNNPHNKPIHCLPAWYCDTFPEPNFGKDRFVWSTRDNAKDTCLPVMKALNLQFDIFKLKGFWMNSKNITKSKRWSKIDDRIIDSKLDKTPYNEIRDVIRRSSLMITVEGRSSVMDAISLGVAPLAYERGSTFPFLREEAANHGVLIPKDFSVEDVGKNIDKLLTNKDLYTDYVKSLQKHIKVHTQEGAHQKFKEMLDIEFG